MLPQDEPTFEVFVQLQPKKTKQKKPKSSLKQVGPFNMKFSLSWEGFLRSIASDLKVPPSNLDVNSFQWKFTRPKTSNFLPVTNEEGFASLLKKLQAKKADQSIFLSMDQFTLLASLVCMPPIYFFSTLIVNLCRT